MRFRRICSYNKSGIKVDWSQTGSGDKCLFQIQERPLAARRFGVLRFGGALRYCFRMGNNLSLQRETDEPVSINALILNLPMLMVSEGCLLYTSPSPRD